MSDTKDLPVLAIGINVDNVGDGWVAPPADRNPTLTAKAVPDALWEDAGFYAAIVYRLVNLPDGNPASIYTLRDIIPAIAAELTHRLQPEVDA
jgi:hypothetical protein